ncbi:hypothetical protein, partial [Rhizobium ruizarguesonis]|uniref:hypothetical protein n=1 Tax=Rhizobium ruizarguesonis TaxID=2081791 RepID=UPI001AEEE008
QSEAIEITGMSHLEIECTLAATQSGVMHVMELKYQFNYNDLVFSHYLYPQFCCRKVQSWNVTFSAWNSAASDRHLARSKPRATLAQAPRPRRSRSQHISTIKCKPQHRTAA